MADMDMTPGGGASDPTQVAQAGPGGDAQPIGQVTTMGGEVTVTHPDGSQSVLEPGAPVFQGDQLSTSGDGSVGITLADGTTFSMAENGSMVLDEMVYDPGTHAGSISVSVMEGVFTFVSGQIAKSDPDAMTLSTPVATIGIRGTQVGIDVGDGGETNVVLMEEGDGFVGEVVVSNQGGVQILNVANQGTGITSADQAPAPSFQVDRAQLMERFGGALERLPDGNNANKFGRDAANREEQQEKQEQENQQTEEQAQTEQTATEETTTEETLTEVLLQEEAPAEDGEQVAEGTSSEEVLAEAAEGLADFETASGSVEEGLADGMQDPSETPPEETISAEDSAVAAGFDTASGPEETPPEDAPSPTSTVNVVGEDYTVANNSIVQNFTGGGPGDGGGTAGGPTIIDEPDVIPDVIPDVAPVLAGGDTTGDVEEDEHVHDGNLTASGELDYDDVDGGPGPDFANASVTKVPGEGGALPVGTLTIDDDGEWTYTVDNDNPAIQGLGEGVTATEVFTVTLPDGSSQDITITVTGTDDLPLIGGDTTGDVLEDLSITGQLTVSDADEGENVDFTGATVDGPNDPYGTLDFDTTTGEWTYTADQTKADELSAGEVKTETFTVELADGTKQDIEITVTGTDDLPVLAGGMVSGDVEEDDDVDSAGNLTASGELDYTDIDDNEDFSLATVTPPAGALGSLAIDPTSGDWTYTADNAQAGIQGLSEDETLTETFTVTMPDNSTQDVTITITGTNDIPTIGGETTGDTIVEDSGVLTTGGTLTIADIDEGESTFQADSQTVDSGTFTVGTDGEWSFTATNGSDAIQSLGAGDALTETFVVTSQDGTATETVTVTITGTNDIPTIGGETSGDVIEEDGNLTTGGVLTIADADAGESAFQESEQTVDSGTFTVEEDGTWSFEADNDAIQSLGEGDTLTETFVVTSQDGTATETVTVTITGTNDLPVLTGGGLTGDVLEDDHVEGVLSATGTVEQSDIDGGPALTFTAGVAAGAYGDLTIAEDGSWTYTAANNNPDIQGLAEGETATETFTVTASDGTEEQVTIILTGTNDAPVIEANETLYVDADDGATVITADMLQTGDIDNTSGELTYTLNSAPNGLVSLDGVALGEDGTFTQADIDAGLITYTPGVADSDSFDFTVSDGLESVDGTFEVEIENDNAPPVLVGGETGATDEDHSFAGTLLADDPDGDDDNLTFALDTSDGAVQPEYGTITINADGSYSYTPDADQQSMNVDDTLTDTFTFTVTDEDGASITQTGTITLSGLNDAPELEINEVLQVDADDGATVITADMLQTGDIDNSADELTYTLTTEPNGLVSLDGAALRAGDTFTQADIDAGLVTYTPGEGGGAGGEHDWSDSTPSWDDVTEYIATGTLSGGVGGDTLHGGGGGDTLSGGDGDDEWDSVPAVDQSNLTMQGDGSVTITFESEGTRSKDAMGWYKLDANGNPTEPQLLFTNSQSNSLVDGQATFTLDGLAEGEQFGLFIIKDAGDEYGWLDTNDTLSFDAWGNLSDGNHTVDDNDIFLTSSDHATGGIADDGSMMIGFENNSTYGGGGDFDDLVVSVGYIYEGPPTSDSFDFVVTDGDGGQVPGTFEIEIEPAVALKTIMGSSGGDTLSGTDGNDAIIGLGGGDTLSGGDGDDVIDGGSGGDMLYGGDGNDVLDGGTGSDTLFGGDGEDALSGGTSGDRLYGGEGDDSLDGGEGNDRLYGGDDDDDLSGDDGEDKLYGGDGNDELDGGDGNDKLWGGDGTDIVFGGDGSDKLYGEDGNDVLSGGAGNDSLLGGDGADTLTGGTGDDKLWGGDDADVFVFHAGDGSDTIMDFGMGDELIFEGAEFSLEDMNVTQSGDDAIITFGDDAEGTQVRLKDVAADDIRPGSQGGYSVSENESGVQITYDTGSG